MTRYSYTLLTQTKAKRNIVCLTYTRFIKEVHITDLIDANHAHIYVYTMRSIKSNESKATKLD